MTVSEIIEKYLKENGYDGLYNLNGECACEIGDLIPCVDYCGDCKPGYKKSDPSGEYDFIISSSRPRTRKNEIGLQKEEN